MGHIFNQSKFSQCSKDWLLLDHQSTLDQIANKEYLTDIQMVDKPSTVFCNAGSTATYKKGMFVKFKLWHHLDVIVNVNSLKIMKKHYWVNYDSYDRDGLFTVHTPKGTMEFIHHPRGLHYMDLIKTNHAEVLLAMTVEEWCEVYTKQQVASASNACCLQGMMGHSSPREFKEMVCEKYKTVLCYKCLQNVWF